MKVDLDWLTIEKAPLVDLAGFAMTTMPPDYLITMALAGRKATGAYHRKVLIELLNEAGVACTSDPGEILKVLAGYPESDNLRLIRGILDPVRPMRSLNTGGL